MNIDNTLISNQKQRNFVYPNYELNFGANFIRIFTQKNQQDDAYQYLISQMNYFLISLNEQDLDFNDEISVSLHQIKLNVQITSINAIRFLIEKYPGLKLSEQFKLLIEPSFQVIGYLTIILKKFQKDGDNQFNTQIYMSYIVNFLCLTETWLGDAQNHCFSDNRLFYEIIEQIMYLLKVHNLHFENLMLSLHLILKIDPQGFEVVAQKVIENLQELMNNPQTTDVQNIAIIKFLHTFNNLNVAYSRVLKQSNLIFNLCQNNKLLSITDEQFYIQGQRSQKQIFWCFILGFFRDFATSCIKDIGFFNQALFFVKTFYYRIQRILRMPTLLQKQDNLTMVENQFDYSFSLAYAEELNQTLQLLSVFFKESNLFQQSNHILFEIILFDLTNSTTSLFRSHIQIKDIFTIHTRYERQIHQIYNYEHPNKIQTSEMNYYPSLFIFKLENYLMDICQYLLFNIKQALSISELFKMFDENDLEETKETQNSLKIKYDISYWERLCQGFCDIQSYIKRTGHKWIVNERLVKELISKLEVFRGSLENSQSNLGLDLLNKVYSFQEKIQQCVSNLNLAFFVTYMHFELLFEFQKIYQYIDDDIGTFYQEKTSLNIDESLKYFKIYLKQSDLYDDDKPLWVIYRYQSNRMIQ